VKEKKRMKMSEKPKENEFITTGEAAKMLGVSQVTIWRWAERGLIRSIELPSGQKRIYKQDILDILEGKRKVED